MAAASKCDYDDNDGDKIHLLRQRVKEQHASRKQQEKRRKEQEKALIDEYVVKIAADRELKKKEINDRLASLIKPAKDKSPPRRGGAVGALLLSTSNSPQDATDQAKAADSPRAAMLSKLGSMHKIAGASSPKPPTTAAAVAAANQRRKDKRHEAAVEAKVAELNAALKGRRMLEAFERRGKEAQEKGRRKQGSVPTKLPELEGSAAKEAGAASSTASEDGQEVPDPGSQRHLARRQRLRQMRRVAAQVLNGKKQLAGCLDEAQFPAMMVWG
eukprot:TRINITY_DN13840_c0_g1_i1.p1 TRINITY_DN13840_c0_g1~~TRINITY_DN13840_c0_g1_i1.p1  ORF type:complete len:280 (+),score=83.59 TRINITY_DN13840_c0_g1_i1:26-841(+)